MPNSHHQPSVPDHGNNPLHRFRQVSREIQTTARRTRKKILQNHPMRKLIALKHFAKAMQQGLSSRVTGDENVRRRNEEAVVRLSRIEIGKLSWNPLRFARNNASSFHPAYACIEAQWPIGTDRH